MIIERVSKIRGVLVNCIKSEKKRDKRRVRHIANLQIDNGIESCIHINATHAYACIYICIRILFMKKINLQTCSLFFLNMT